MHPLTTFNITPRYSLGTYVGTWSGGGGGGGEGGKQANKKSCTHKQDISLFSFAHLCTAAAQRFIRASYSICLFLQYP